MNEGYKKFEELMRSDAGFQSKLKEASENYTGDKTLEAVYQNVLKPLAEEYGISGTFEEFQEYLEKIQGQDGVELNSAELSQVAGGGKGGGLAKLACIGVGIGAGGGGGSGSGGVCAGIGVGTGKTECLGVGDSEGID